MAAPHRRLNLLTGESVLVSPQRTLRPWSGLEESPQTETLPAYDPDCYLCPGNERAAGARNPDYPSTFVFTNDFPALLPDQGETAAPAGDDLLIAEPELGVCRVICYSPRHDLTMARMHQSQVLPIIECWQDQYRSLGEHPSINYVQIFENKGVMMGCSNPHPHGQVWATGSIPTIPLREDRRQKEFFQRNDRCLLCTYVERELSEGERLVCTSDSFLALVPFWAVWPFELMVIPRNHTTSMLSMTEAEKKELASLLIRLGVRYDNLFNSSFPYSMGIHQQPTDGRSHEHHHWHIHFLPPLLRSPSIRKHMVGYELLAMVQRDISSEEAAVRLRDVSEHHYLDGGFP